MATLTSARADTRFPMYTGASGACCVAYGTYELAAAPSTNDVIEFCRVPEGAVIVGGWLYADDIDTGSGALELDIGTAADPDMLLNSGALNGTAVANVNPEGGIKMPLGGVLLSDGPVLLTADTTIQGTVIAAPNAGGTGTVSLVVYYTMRLTTT